MTPGPSVICLGDLMVDVVARLAAPLALGSDTAAEVDSHGGGSAANTAAWLVRAGANAIFVGRVGDDEAGRQAVAALRLAGVRTEVTVDPDRPTGMCVVLVDRSGERTMIPSPGANAGALAVTPDRLRELIGPDGALHVSGYALFHPAARSGVRAVLTEAARLGRPVSVDAASAAPLRLIGAETFLGWLPGQAVLLANTDEAAVLTGSSDPMAAVRALGRRCAAAVVKLGPGGSAWSDGDQVCLVPTTPRSDVVDTTGAGDAFAAGWLAARLGGAGVGDGLAVGNALAAEAIGQVGARPT